MSPTLSLPVALFWIVASMLVCSGGGYALFKKSVRAWASASSPVVEAIVQTGPQKEALKIEYLAELLNLSSDRPCKVAAFHVDKAKSALLRSPLIASAEVKLIKPSTVYVDYTVRQPVAWLEDYENVVIDKEGYPFPFTPFFAPKNLPALYFGWGAFGGETASAQWGRPLRGKEVSLGFDILNALASLADSNLCRVVRIDLSHAFADSYGMREIVLSIEDTMVIHSQGEDVHYVIPRLLRLSTKNYAEGLGNYLKLRERLLEEEQHKLALSSPEGPRVRLQEQVLDFRLGQLAFIPK